MPTYYIDESGDEKVFVYAALRVPAETHTACENALRAFRQRLWESDGVPLEYELHATKWIRGKGRPGGHEISKSRRAEIFRDVLDTIAALPGVEVFGVVAPSGADEDATERLLAVLNEHETDRDTRAHLLADNGQEVVWNRVWHRSERFRLESLAFGDSAASWFLQMADFAAYALLRHESPRPTGYSLNEWERLAPVVVRRRTISPLWDVSRLTDL